MAPEGGRTGAITRSAANNDNNPSNNNSRSGDSEMSNQWFDLTVVRSSGLRPRRALILVGLSGALLANSASAAPGDNLSVVRDLASRVGPIIGSALACQNIARSRVQVIIDKFQA